MGIELAASSFRSHKHRAFAKREGERSMEPLNFANSSLRSLARLPANFPAIMSFRPSGSVYSSSLPRRGHCLCSDFRARECTSINASEALTAERERESGRLLFANLRNFTVIMRAPADVCIIIESSRRGCITLPLYYINFLILLRSSASRSAHALSFCAQPLLFLFTPLLRAATNARVYTKIFIIDCVSNCRREGRGGILYNRVVRGIN